MARFLLLLHRPASTVSGVSPEDLRERIQRYRTWNQEMTRSGKVLGGEKCADGGLWLRPDGETRTAPAGENGHGDVVSGYFLIQANDYQEASEIGRSCPHLAYGGTIELRQIEAT
jgi:hypothetical protein